MAESNFRGPVNAMGALEIQGGTAATVEAMDGPSQFYQGIGFPDIRNVPFAKDGTAPGRQVGYLVNPSTITVDNIPQASGTVLTSGLVVASANVTATGVLTIVSTPTTNTLAPAAHIALGVPIVPQGTTVVTTAPLAIDFGFTAGTTTANSSTVQVTDNTLFTSNQWICIGNVANAAGTASLLTQVLNISSTNFTTINVGPNLPATALCAPIGQANLFGAVLLPPATQFGPSAAAAVSVSPDIVGGFGRWKNPAEHLARALNITVQAIDTAATTTSFTITGWDVHKQYMTERIATATLGSSPATVAYFGKKAFKYINTITCTLLGTSATVAVSLSDVFGFPIRADYFAQTDYVAGNTASLNNVGFTAAVSTTGSPATSTTGDVRGTVQLSSNGGGTPITNVCTSNGTSRLTIVQNIGVWNMLAGTPLNTVPIFGTQQSTA